MSLAGRDTYFRIHRHDRAKVHRNFTDALSTMARPEADAVAAVSRGENPFPGLTVDVVRVPQRLGSLPVRSCSSRSAMPRSARYRPARKTQRLAPTMSAITAPSANSRSRAVRINP